MRAGDILHIEAEPESLTAALTRLELSVEEATDTSDEENDASDKKEKKENPASGDSDVVILELVPLPQARIVGRSMDAIKIRTRYGLSLLAISRKGRRIIKRLPVASIKAGDVLLLKGSEEALA